MAGRKETGRRRTSAAKAEKVKTPSQEALELTWVLKGNLKNAQVSYLRIGSLLAQIRDRQLYGALHHDSIEAYAEERLNLGRTSLYRYLQVHDWAAASHPDWLQPKPAGFIPDLSDAGDLMWIEKQLAAKDVAATTRAKLVELQSKALKGQLRQRELDAFRKQAGARTDAVGTFLSKLRTLRRSGLQLKQLPPEAIAKLDAAIEVIVNAMAVQKAGSAPAKSPT